MVNACPNRSSRMLDSHASAAVGNDDDIIKFKISSENC